MQKTMKCYLLLRDNVESGPYDLAEITLRSLLPTDLIWVEGSSHSWHFPAEIAELAPLVQGELPADTASAEPEKEKGPKGNQSIFVALPPQPAAPLPPKEEPVLETLYEAPLEELKIKYENHLQQRRFRFAASSRKWQGAWIAALFAGLLAGAFMIKKMVDAGDESGSSGASAAAMPATDFPPSGDKPPVASYRNALTTEVVPVDNTTATPKIAKKKVNLKKLVTLSANDYKKGVFGGINQLSFQVKNKSEHVLDKVTIEIKYLKPNGDVIKKENHYLKAIAPKSTKILEIPPSNRGVDIKYRITKIQSHEASAAMRDL